MTKILMIGSDSSVKGGITSVISQLKNHDWNKENVKMKFIPSYIETNKIVMILFFGIAVIRIIFSILLFRPDIAYIHMSYKGSFMRKNFIHRICKLFRVKTIIHLHGSEFEKWYNSSDENKKQKIKKLIKECDRLLVLGEEWERRILTIEPATKTEIIKNTVKIPAETVKWNEEKFKVLFLGVLIKRKGVEDLLEAIKVLKDTDSIGKLFFVVAGTGEEEETLKKKADELGIAAYVDFVGWTSGEKKVKLFKECQAMVLPSYNEGLPVAVLEAISYGMPVVATDVGDMKAAVKNGYNGFLITPGDCESLADSLFKLNDEDTFRKMSDNSITLANEEFSDEMYFIKLAKIFNDLNVG